MRRFEISPGHPAPGAPPEGDVAVRYNDGTVVFKPAPPALEQPPREALQPAREDPDRWSPTQVLELALSCIRPDGTVKMYDDVEQKIFFTAPHRPVEIERLWGPGYATALMSVAESIYGAMAYKRRDPHEQAARIENLASRLTAHIHDREFLARAIARIRYENDFWGWQLHHLTGAELHQLNEYGPTLARLPQADITLN